MSVNCFYLLSVGFVEGFEMSAANTQNLLGKKNRLWRVFRHFRLQTKRSLCHFCCCGNFTKTTLSLFFYPHINLNTKLLRDSRNLLTCQTIMTITINALTIYYLPGENPVLYTSIHPSIRPKIFPLYADSLCCFGLIFVSHYYCLLSLMLPHTCVLF